MIKQIGEHDRCRGLVRIKYGIVWLVSVMLVLVAGGMSRIAETAQARETVKKGVLTKLEILAMIRMISPPCGS